MAEIQSELIDLEEEKETELEAEVLEEETQQRADALIIYMDERSRGKWSANNNIDNDTTTSGSDENGILCSALGKKKRAKTETEVQFFISIS